MLIPSLQVFHLNHKEKVLKPLQFPDNLSVRDALERVLRLPSVASKRYLTNKVHSSFLNVLKPKMLKKIKSCDFELL